MKYVFLKLTALYKIIGLQGKMSEGPNFVSDTERKKPNKTTHIVRTAGYWQKNNHRAQQNRTESPEIEAHKYCQLIFNKGTKTI